ncbi:hypothetical protein K6I34_004873, partial [Streptomyces sp. UNOC14_S4]|nr:hypothetical protein [Streptomyces sp. UNOC14_S4]
MHRLPATAALAAVALVAAAGCVAVPSQSTGHDAARPHHSRSAGPEPGPGRAREALVDIGPDASGKPQGDPSRNPSSHAPPGTPADPRDPHDPRA